MLIFKIQRKNLSEKTKVQMLSQFSFMILMLKDVDINQILNL
jgi:hypothetical protein